MKYQGACHCGAVQFEVEAGEVLEADDCNCSICKKSGFLHFILPRDHFRLITGERSLTTYTFNTHQAKHTFCKICGVKPFYVPRSNPDGISVNVNCLDVPDARVNVTPFDGKNWEQHAHRLAHKSDPGGSPG